jgi:predicted Fe-Mo cluster-binding NifX family protein
VHEENQNLTRIIVPVEDQNALESQVAAHFGRAPYFAVVDFEDGKVKALKMEPNTGEHHGGSGHPHENLLTLKPNMIIAQAMGPGGLQSFRQARIIVLKAKGGTIKELMQNFAQGKLSELEAGCEHAHHHEEGCGGGH